MEPSSFFSNIGKSVIQAKANSSGSFLSFLKYGLTVPLFFITSAKVNRWKRCLCIFFVWVQSFNELNKHGLGVREYIFLFHKRHLKVQLSKFWLPVPAGVLIAHAPGNLKIFFKTSNH